MQIENLGMWREPFDKSGQPVVFVHYQSQQAADDFLQSVLNDNRGIGVLYGIEPSGKTTVVNQFVRSLPAEIAVAVVNGKGFGASELLATMLAQFGYKGSIDLADDLFKLLQKTIYRNMRKDQAPAQISPLSVKGKQAKPYPLSWSEQDTLFQELPRHLADAALFAVNTGCREQEVCQLRWDWEVHLPEMETSVFILGTAITKTSTERVVVLNAVARRVIESRRGKHKERVFTYRSRPLGKLHSSAWKRAWKAAKLPTEPSILKGVHNLRHTFGRRLRSAGIPLETRKALLGHADGDITTHYSAAELNELILAAESIVSRGKVESPNLMLIRRCDEKSVGKVSEMKKGLTAKTC